MKLENIGFLLLAGSTISLGVACSDSSSNAPAPDTTDAGVIEADGAAEADIAPDASPEVGQEAALPDAAPPQDPLCREGLSCQDIDGAGFLACVDSAGQTPADAVTGCHDVADCVGNSGCMYTNDEKTASVCIENCGACADPLTCMDVTGDGYLGCLADGDIPSGAVTGCHNGGGCDGNATCFYTSSDKTQSVCIQNCSPCTDETCAEGEVCDGIMCVPAPCTEGSCPAEEICYEGTCIPDIGDGPGSDTVGDCTLPELICDPTQVDCAELIQFDPTQGDGYYDYPENGETSANQYRSWLRRDVVMLVKYAAAKVACKAKDWTFGNGGPVGLIDMSEQNGAIPGTSVNQPGHPQGTHTNGFDIDIAYFQVNTANNRARPICDHYQNGKEAYHCTAAPHLLDPWRTALFIGAMYEHPRLRVIGADGKAGPMIDKALDILCAGGWLPTTACSKDKLMYEVTDQGYGWYLFHHHHIHVSFLGTQTASHKPASSECLVPGCEAEPYARFLEHSVRPVVRIPMTDLLSPLAR